MGLTTVQRDCAACDSVTIFKNSYAGMPVIDSKYRKMNLQLKLCGELCWGDCIALADPVAGFEG